MGTGQNDVKINPRERALSVDINRLQAMTDAAEMLIQQALEEALIVTDFNGLGAPSAPSGPVTVPNRFTVFTGLMVNPQTASFNLTIDEGMLGVYLPDAVPNPDDSPYKYVKDPGIQSLGTLVVAPNGGGGPRIDVVECSVIDYVAETDNRDIFDPTTGLFNPVTVDKVICKRLSYRVRQGVAANGYPGGANGWMPLCIISVPVGALSLDTCTLWDVRPLAQGRVQGPGKTVTARHNLSRAVTTVDASAGPGAARLIGGVAESDSGMPWKSGGFLRTGAYYSQLAYPTSFDLTDATNWEPGFAPVQDQLYYIYVLPNPFGLPRWAKYSSGVTPRYPLDPAGIYVISNKAPSNYGGAVAGIQIPTIYGLGNVTQSGIALLAGIGNDFGAGVELAGTVTRGHIHQLEGTGPLGGPAGIPLTPITALSNVVRSYLLTPGITHPSHAKSVVIVFQVNTEDGPAFTNNLIGIQNSFFVRDSALTYTKMTWYESPGFFRSTGVAPGNGTTQIYVEVPAFPGEDFAVTHGIELTGLNTVNVISSFAWVVGWSF